MKEVTCSQCGQMMPDSYSRCPVCGQTIDNRVQSTAQKRFVVWFVLLTIFCVVLALWLPR